MCKPERQIEEQALIEDILARGRVLYLAMSGENTPYVLPLSYGYQEGKLYLHCAPEGRKITLLRANPQVGFVISLDDVLVPGERSCGWSFRYRSLVGEGVVRFVDDEAGKRAGLDALMRQHGGKGGDYTQEAVARTMVLEIAVTKVTGKQSGYAQSEG